MKCLQAYTMFFICAWTQAIFSADEQPQRYELCSSKHFTASMPRSVDDMNEKELRAYVAHLQEVLVNTTAQCKAIFELQQRKIKQLEKENEELARKQGE